MYTVVYIVLPAEVQCSVPTVAPRKRHNGSGTISTHSAANQFKAIAESFEIDLIIAKLIPLTAKPTKTNVQLIKTNAKLTQTIAKSIKGKALQKPPRV